jgi:hypothetical protein
MANMNIRKGLIRLSLVATVLAFGSGAYFDFSPSTWLYENEDYTDIASRATFELSEQKNCKTGKISYFQLEGEPNNPIYLICDTQNEGTCKSMKDCSGLEKYAQVIGKDAIGKGVDIQSLTQAKIKSELNLIKTERFFDMFKERALSGFYNVIELWKYLIISALFIIALNWIYKGFVKNNN